MAFRYSKAFSRVATVLDQRLKPEACSRIPYLCPKSKNVIVIDNVLISDDVVEKQFVCDLSKCKGGCCEEGDAGAPLEDAELDLIIEYYEKVKPYLTPA